MTNLELLNSMLTRYENLAYTSNYMMGYPMNGNIYCSITTSALLPLLCKVEDASRGAGKSLRFKPSKAQKNLLRNEYTFVVCSEKYFDELVSGSKYNRGEIFEKLVTEYFGQVWTKDHVPFTKAGDIVVDGIAYQIKYDKATFTNEVTLNRLSTRF